MKYVSSIFILFETGTVHRTIKISSRPCFPLTYVKEGVNVLPERFSVIVIRSFYFLRCHPHATLFRLCSYYTQSTTLSRRFTCFNSKMCHAINFKNYGHIFQIITVILLIRSTFKKLELCNRIKGDIF